MELSTETVGRMLRFFCEQLTISIDNYQETANDWTYLIKNTFTMTNAEDMRIILEKDKDLRIFLDSFSDFKELVDLVFSMS